MNTPSVTRFFLALMSSCVVLSLPAHAQAVLRIEAIDRTDTLAERPETELFLGAGFNGWDPAGTAQSDWLEDTDGARIGWVFEIPKSLVEHGGQFKFTRGSWATVESTAEGFPIENRRTGTPIWKDAEPTMRFEILGFEDHHRDPVAEQASTVTGGTLEIWTMHSEHLDEDRTVRVWLPEAYTQNPDQAFGVFYFHDGQNVFDVRSSAFGVEWQADEAMSKLVDDSSNNPWILVGIDHSGVNRSRDYLPFMPGKGYPSLPGGGADKYLRFVTGDLMPEIARRYRVLGGPEHTGLGGASLGGVITLYAAMILPDMFGVALIESPSLWIGDREIMKMVKAFEGEWSARVFLAIGDSETGKADQDEGLVQQLLEVKKEMVSQGLGKDRLRVVIGEGDRHNEAAWQRRLPEAFEFLLSP